MTRGNDCLCIRRLPAHMASKWHRSGTCQPSPCSRQAAALCGPRRTPTRHDTKMPRLTTHAPITVACFDACQSPLTVVVSQSSALYLTAFSSSTWRRPRQGVFQRSVCAPQDQLVVGVVPLPISLLISATTPSLLRNRVQPRTPTPHFWRRVGWIGRLVPGASVCCDRAHLVRRHT
jgi:hypothetical protein